MRLHKRSQERVNRTGGPVIMAKPGSFVNDAVVSLSSPATTSRFLMSVNAELN